MRMQIQMGLMRTSRFIVVVTLLCLSALISSEERSITEEVSLTRLVDPATGKINGDIANLLWVCCKVDPADLVETIQDLHLWFPEETSSSRDEISMERQSLEEENVQKVIHVLHPQVKQTLSDCFRKNNVFLRVSAKESASEIWGARYIESLFPGYVPRRKMGSEFLETFGQFAEVPSPAPASKSFELGPVSSLGTGISASSIPRPLSCADPPGSLFPHVFRKLVSLPSDSTPASGSDIQITKKTSDNEAIIVAVAVTATVTFLFATVLFFCCIKFCGIQQGGRQNDEKPLLSLTIYGSGVSLSYPYENSLKGDKLEHQEMELGSIGRASKSRLEVYEASKSRLEVYEASKSRLEVYEASNNEIEKIEGTPNGVPPLKPPPGRVNHLPPEPPCSFKPPPNTVDCPPTTLPPASPPTSDPSGVAASPPSPPALVLGPKPPPPPPPACSPRPQPPATPSPFPQPPSTPSPCPQPPSATGPPPPPFPRAGAPPLKPPPSMHIGSKIARPPPLAPKRASNTTDDGGAPKTKLKPFFWDKVLANPDQSMVWHQIKSGSFQFDENMIESLFGFNAGDKNTNNRRREPKSQDPTPELIQLISPKKAQNISILLRALNVTVEEVCDAIREGNELPPEFVQTLLKMEPTQEEELKLRVFDGELSQLGPAERFLRSLIDVPFAFKRLEALHFMCSLQEEITNLKESFATLEVACNELRNSRLFLKLLEAVLKTGNRMNDGTFRGGAQAFKLDTLLKLSDVKGTDGKTTLLHFVVREIIRSEGVRAARARKGSQSFDNNTNTDDILDETSYDTDEHYRTLGLEKVSGLSQELENVKRASVLDAESLMKTVAKLRYALVTMRDFLNTDMKKSGEESGFHDSLKNFVETADVDIKGLHEEEKRIMALVKSTGNYFHGNSGKDEGLRLFVVVGDFLIILDRVCKEVRSTPKKSSTL